MTNLRLDDLEVAVTEGGHGLVELLFVHGIRNAAWVWGPTLERLDPERFRWLALDLPGCGASGDPPDWQGCTIQASAALVSRLISGRVHRPPVVVGHSLGAAIAVAAALADRDLVAGLALVAPASFGGIDLPIEEVLAGAFAADTDVEALGRVAFSTQPPDADFDRLVATVRSARAVHIEGALRSLHDFAVRDRLPTLGTPCLVMGGDEDRHVASREMYLTAAALRRPRVQIWSGVGHVPHWERPDELVALLERFATDVAI